MARCEDGVRRIYYERHRWNEAATECIRCGEPSHGVKKRQNLDTPGCPECRQGDCCGICDDCSRCNPDNQGDLP